MLVVCLFQHNFSLSGAHPNQPLFGGCHYKMAGCFGLAAIACTLVASLQWNLQLWALPNKDTVHVMNLSTKDTT